MEMLSKEKDLSGTIIIGFILVVIG